MAITVNVDNLVSSLVGAGYKNIGMSYQSLKDLKVNITADFTKMKSSLPNGDGYEISLPSSPTVVSNNIHNKVMVTPFVLAVNSFFGAMVDLAQGNQVSDPTVEIEHKSSGETFYKNGKAFADAQSSVYAPKNDPVDAVSSVAMDFAGKGTDTSATGIIGNLIKQGLSDALDIDPPAQKKTQSIAQQNLFKDCGSIVCGKFDEDMVHLRLAEELLQPVYGSSATSTYYCIALCTYAKLPINIAVRVVSHDDTNYTVSLRFEWKGLLPDTKLKNVLSSNGYSVKEDYASIHFTAPKVDAVRAITAMIYCMPLEYHQTAQLNFLG